MITADRETTPITTAHRARLAYVYVRQSSVGQVLHHRESTDLQYRLVERAIALGWPRDRVRIIDADLGKSGASANERAGFQHLIAEISLARVGVVLSLDASRLARNNSDWHHLLELCALFGTLIADCERLYDPEAYHDRLLLGLSGMMSEAELHALTLRLHAGERHKAERGELALGLPAGLVRLPEGTVILDPDEEVQARVRLVFQKFAELGSAKAVVRYCLRAGLPLPTRPRRGPAPHPLCWQPATSSRVLALLKNPAYAGAYVYGRSTTDRTRRTPGHPCSGQIRRPLVEWPVCLQGVYPAYIGWDEFVAMQAQLSANQCRYAEEKHGVPRQGQALLQGIAVCGRCGRRMRLRYSGPQGQFPVYQCAAAQAQQGRPRCQEVRALGVDAEVERLVLAALAPDRLALALDAWAHLQEEEGTLQHQWQLRLERARYEAERAHRQFDAVEPENRLVARTLERAWEDKLRASERLEQEYHRWLQERTSAVTVQDRELILALGQDLPALWHAPTTTAAERKRLVRLVVKDVILDQHRARGQVWLQINWQTGACTEHWVERCVRSYTDFAELEALQHRVRTLHAEGRRDAEIAATLNAEGFHTARGQCFSDKLIWCLRRAWGLPKVTPRQILKEEGNETHVRYYSVSEAAAAIGVFPGTIYKWLTRGRLPGRQLGQGLPWVIPLTQEHIDGLRQYVERVRRSKREAV
jgi:DNA invertase Pin-like site-specific DNA recombinase